MFFSNVSALSALSVPRRDRASGAEERAGLRLPTTAGAEAHWGSPRLPLQLSPGKPWRSVGWGQKGSGLSDAWLSPVQMQPQLLCKEGNGAPLAGGEMWVLVLTPEVDVVLQRGRTNSHPPSYSSPSHAGAVPLHQCKGEGCNPPVQPLMGAGQGVHHQEHAENGAGAWSKQASFSFPETFPRGPWGAFPFALAVFKQAQFLGTMVHAPSLKASLMTF